MSDNEWAVILGVSAGTGAAIAKEVSRSPGPGLNVFGMHRGRYAEGAVEVERAVAANGRKSVVRQADAATLEGTQAAADALLEAAGPRSVKLFVHSLASASLGPMVHGVGHAHDEKSKPLEPARLERTFAVMAHSFLYWARELLSRDLLAKDACLLGLANPLSESLLLHNTGVLTAAKAALEVYVRALAIELGPRGHRVILLKFGTVMTPAVRHVYSPESLANLERVHQQIIPAGRMCTVEEVAKVVASMLLSGESAWFNGSTVDMTGGMTLQLLDAVLNPQRYQLAPGTRGNSSNG
jgi:NAD(P)-dependent dehydrogenase (short-subunit alcohol dehydrogenase family)